MQVCSAGIEIRISHLAGSPSLLHHHDASSRGTIPCRIGDTPSGKRISKVHEVRISETFLKKGGFFEKKDTGDLTSMTVHRDLPIEIDEVKPNQQTSTEGSMLHEDIESIFSSNTLSTVPSSANPVYISGIKDVAQALLS